MGAKNTSVVLTEHFVNFAERQVHEGRYGSTSEVVRAGLRLLEEQEAKLSELRRALTDGAASGVDHGFDFDEFIGAIDDPQ